MTRRTLRDDVERSLVASWWGQRRTIPWLIPFSWLYCVVVWLRRWAYRLGWLPSHGLGVPVVVVGNITLGGTGKTPLIIWLAQRLAQRGWRPGIISRGYGGRATATPHLVTGGSDPAESGDEPVMMAGRTGVPMAVGADRLAAGRLLLANHDCDLILADDGLQHYRLRRALEIGVIDGIRGLGNGRCLPAGPLREPAGRLDGLDWRLVNGGSGYQGLRMDLVQGEAIHLRDPSKRRPLEQFRSAGPVHAVAGIGHPARFFRQLEEQGLVVIAHPFADHAPYSAGELDFGDQIPVLMTEKDAVKYRPHAQEWHWYVPVEVQLDEQLVTDINQRLRSG